MEKARVKKENARVKEKVIGEKNTDCPSL